MKFWAERGHIMQMKMGMVKMSGLGSLVNYKDLDYTQLASIRDWAHMVVTESFNDQLSTPAEMGSFI